MYMLHLQLNKIKQLWFFVVVQQEFNGTIE